MKPILTVLALTLAAPVFADPAPDRTVVIVSNEIKMTRAASRTPYPDTLERHPDLMAGGGYRLEEPDDKGEWYARAYQWSPGVVYAYEGERLLLEFFGINGDVHPTEIPAFGQSFDVRRGEITRVEFVLDKSGLFEIVAPGRAPSMTAQLVVLPRP